MRYATSALTSLLFGTFTVACTVQSGLDSQDVAHGWRSTQSAMADAGISATPTAGTVSGTGSVGPDGVSGTATGTFDCPQGGSVTVHSEGDVTSADVTGAVSIEFDGCTADDVTIDGTLDYEGTVQSDLISASIKGSVTWSGAVQGECDIDVSAQVTSSGVSGSAKLGGDVCGHAWANLGS